MPKWLPGSTGESEQQARHALDAAQAGTWKVVPATGAFTASDRALALHGLPPGMPMSHEAALSRVFPDDRPMIEAALRRTLETGEPFDLELRVMQSDGSLRWVLSQAERVDDGETSVMGLVKDITDRKRAEMALRESEERQAFLLDLSDALRPLTDAAAVERVAARMLGEALGADHAFYATIDPSGDSWSIDYDYANGLPSVSGRYPFSGFQEKRLAQWRAGIVSSVADSENDPSLTAEDRAAYAAFGARAAIGVPLVRDGRFAALLVVNQAGPREWTDAEITLVREVAERTWMAIGRARAEAALRGSEERYRALFDTIDEGFCIVERVPGDPADFRYLTVNPAFKRQSGLTDVVGRTLRELVPTVDEPVLAAYARVADTGGSEAFETFVPGLDRWFEVEATAVDRQGQIAVLFRDITVRMRAEAALRESEERQAFLLRLSDVLRATPSDDLTERALELLVDELQLDLCYVVTVRLDEDRADVVYQRQRGDFPAIPAVIRLSDYPDAFLEWQDRTLVSDDMANDPALSELDRRNVAAMRFGGLIAAPVRRGAGNPIWSIVAVTAQPRRWTAGEIALVEEAAERTWTAIERARAEAALRESEERQTFLLKFSDALRAETGVDAVAVSALRMLIEQLKLDRSYIAAFRPAEDVGDIIYQVGNGSVPPLPATVRWSDFSDIWEQVHDRTFVINDLHESSDLREADRAYFGLPRLRSLVTTTARRGEKNSLNSLVVASSHARRWTIGEISLVEEAAERTWAAMERARVETALRESEERFRALVTAGGNSIYRMSPDWRLMYQLDSDTLATTAAPIEDWVDKYIPPEDLPAVRTAIDSAIRGKSLFELEHRVWAADGGIAWVLSRAVPLLGPDGGIVEWFGAGTLVTERKQTQEALRESEERYRSLFESMDEAYAVVEMLKDDAGRWTDFRFVAVNSAFMVHTGMPYPVGQTATELLGTPNPRWTELYGRALDTGETLRVEEREDTLGVILDLNIFALDRARNRVAVLFTNITERKQAEIALRESEERLGLAIEVGQFASWDWDVRTGQVAWNDRHFLLQGYAIGEITPSFDAWIARVHPDDRAEAVAKINAARDTRTPYFHEFRTLHPDGTVRWCSARGHFFYDGDDAPYRMIGLMDDVTDRHEAQAALKKSEEQQRLTVELVPALLWSASPDGRDISLNEGWSSYTGQSDAETQDFGWLKAVHPDDLPATRAAFEKAFATGDPLERQQRIHKAGDGWRWHLVRHVPVRDAKGTIVRWFGAAVDIHDSKLAEQALQDTERRLQTLVEGVPQLVWRAIDGGHWTWASPQWSDFTGQAEPDSHGWGWLDPVHPDDREKVKEIWAGAVARGEFHADYRIREAAEHRYRWFQTRATPVRNDEGAIVEWLGTSTDVDDLRELQDRQQVLVAELQHRTRNLMGVVRSTADRTGEASVDFADFRHRFHDRLEALARVQGLLSRLNDTDRIAFDELIRTELAAMTGTVDRVTLDGPSGIRLRSSMVQTLAMALHELATNAVKYGALGQPGGHLAITWHMVEPDRRGRPRLHIEWQESGVRMPPPAAAPQGGGQGRELIEQALPYQLSAETSFELGPDGVRCTITIPVSASAPAEHIEG